MMSIGYFDTHNLSVILALKMPALCCLILFLCLICPVQSLDLSKPTFISVNSGEHVTFNCSFNESNDIFQLFIWYKQRLGEMPQNVAQGFTYAEIKISPEFQQSGFKIEMIDNSISLTIPQVNKEHEGLYYCGQFNHDKVAVNLSDGAFLTVPDDRDVKVSVFQRSLLDSVPAGASVTLQCSVLFESRAAELQVLWFRAAPPQSHPQIIYTHHNSRHQCESGSSTHTCVYNFSKNILSLSDTGTYYCAVAACGKIIFGNGTRVQIKEYVDPVVICLSIALCVCVVVITFLSFKWRNCEQHTKIQSTKSRKKKTSPQVHDSMELNYAALDLKKIKAKTERQKRNKPQDTVYSEVRSFTTT